MVYFARMSEMVPPTAGVQEGLNILARTPEFTEVLKEVVLTRKLDLKDVTASIDHLYAKVCDRSKGNDAQATRDDVIIIIRARDFGDNELAALVSFLTIQNKWPRPLGWSESFRSAFQDAAFCI